jgi:3-deoxy-manno-octulosonate cytidylyltransferase (CMP-KDO synthetase)
MEFVVVIPARFASARLPGKPLADIGGLPMIARVHELAVASGASEVIVATDDDRIAKVCRDIGADVQVTSSDHASGTDRIAEVAHRRGWPDARIVVNVQGDEPLLPPALISQVAALLHEHDSAAVATLVTSFDSESDWRDPNTAKVILDRHGHALYFSRAPIPHVRDGGMPANAFRHIGLYAYRVGELRVIAAQSPCPLEQSERLEQLRVLWMGKRIITAVAKQLPPRGVDTDEDLALVRRIIADRGRGQS